jgi:antirestriction protein ArdC
MVASYDRWRRLGRQVNKGEQGMKILFPMKRRITLEGEDGREEQDALLLGFGVGTVFDVAQTSGEPITVPEDPPTDFFDTALAKRLDHKLYLWLAGQGVELSKERCGPRGDYEPPRPPDFATRPKIALRDTLPDDDSKLKTLVHEAAHLVAGHGTTDGPLAWDAKPKRELEAEGGAFAVCNYFGIDTSLYSFAYLKYVGWEPATLKEIMPALARTTSALIAAIGGEPPGSEEGWL